MYIITFESVRDQSSNACGLVEFMSISMIKFLKVIIGFMEGSVDICANFFSWDQWKMYHLMGNDAHTMRISVI